MNASEQDYYQLLKLEYDASSDDVRAAYERLRQLFEANALASYSLFGGDEAASMRERLDRAFAVLSDDNRREEYDAEIGNERDETPSTRASREHREELSDDAPSFSHTASYDGHSSVSLQMRPEPEDEDEEPVPDLPRNEMPSSVAAATLREAIVDSGPPLEALAVPQPPPVTLPTPIVHAAPSVPTPIVHTPLAVAGPVAAPAEAVAAPATETAHPAAVEEEKVGLPDNHEEGQYSGGVLARLRENKNLALTDIAKKTKISLAHLRALEANVYDKLPARIYVRGFVTQYAKCLGLNPLRVADSYLQIYDRYFEKPTHDEKARRQN